MVHCSFTECFFYFWKMTLLEYTFKTIQSKSESGVEGFEKGSSPDAAPLGDSTSVDTNFPSKWKRNDALSVGTRFKWVASRIGSC